jgi:hypothetical protein
VNKDKLKFIAIFFAISLIGLNIPFTKLAGSNVSFTLFDFFAPIAGAFLGPILGVITVLGVELTNIAIKQTPLETGSIIRLFPVLFGTYYFAVMARNKKLKTEGKADSKLILLAPALAIIAFIAHPNGSQVPYFTLFWTIPFIAYFMRGNLFMRSLGATFTQHAVGGAAWIWAFNLPASVWEGLIPVVAMERLVFATGIAVSYLAIRFTLNFLAEKKLLPSVQKINPRYL